MQLVSNNWQLVVGGLLALAGILLLIWRLVPKNDKKSSKTTIVKEAEQDIERIFNEQFREELRNRGRLHFEKILNENAMFLQQDLRLTTSQLNDYMKNEISKTLKDEFAKYEESINDAKKAAMEAIGKTQDAIEQQRQVLSQQLAHELSGEKARLLERFEQNMAEIVNHYVLAAIGNQIDLNDQLEYILSELQQNKQAIIDDIKTGG